MRGNRGLKSLESSGSITDGEERGNATETRVWMIGSEFFFELEDFSCVTEAP